MLLPLQILNLLEEASAPIRIPDPDVVIYGWDSYASVANGNQGIDILYGFDRAARLSSFGYYSPPQLWGVTPDSVLIFGCFEGSSLSGRVDSGFSKIYGSVRESDISGQADDSFVNGSIFSVTIGEK